MQFLAGNVNTLPQQVGMTFIKFKFKNVDEWVNGVCMYRQCFHSRLQLLHSYGPTDLAVWASPRFGFIAILITVLPHLWYSRALTGIEYMLENSRHGNEHCGMPNR